MKHTIQSWLQTPYNTIVKRTVRDINLSNFYRVPVHISQYAFDE